MTEATFQPKGLPILQAFSQIENIKAQRAATGLAQDRFTLGQQQLAQENQRREEQDAIAQQEREFTRLGSERDRNEELLLDPKISANPDIVKRLIGRNNEITSTLSPGSIDIDPEIVVRDMQSFQRDVKSFAALKDARGEEDPIVTDVFGALQNKYMFDPKRAAVVAGAGADVTGARLFQKGEQRAGVTAKRKLGETVETAKAKGEVGLEFQEKGAALAQQTAEQERVRKTSVIQGLGLDPVAERAAIASIEAGFTIPQPREARLQIINIPTGELNELDEPITKPFFVDSAGDKPVLKPLEEQEAEPSAEPKMAVSDKIATEDREAFKVFRKEAVRRHKLAGAPIPVTRIIKQEFNKRK